MKATMELGMDLAELEQYLHEHIPLSRAMQVGIIKANFNEVVLSAPLAPNINHRDTVFGGSASAVAILAAWTLLYVRLQQEAIKARIVIQRNSMEYEQAIVTDFIASASLPDTDQWDHFLRMLTRKHRARIAVRSILYCEEKRVGEMEGEFVALR